MNLFSKNVAILIAFMVALFLFSDFFLTKIVSPDDLHEINSMDKCYHARKMIDYYTISPQTQKGFCSDAEKANNALKWIQKAKYECPKDVQQQFTELEEAVMRYRTFSHNLCKKGF